MNKWISTSQEIDLDLETSILTGKQVREYIKSLKAFTALFDHPKENSFYQGLPNKG